MFYWSNTEAGIKSLGYDLMYCVQAAVNEWKKNGVTDERIKLYYDFTIKWKDLGHNNYEIYVMW